MQDLVLHPTTRKLLEWYIQRPSHALLLEGKAGSGKYFVAVHLAAKILQKKVEELKNYPYFFELQNNNQSILIDTIRELRNFLKLKVAVKKRGITRLIIIEDIERLTTEAQNAFLKILEEPPNNTVFIMTTANVNQLLPTILSRTQTLQVRKPIKSDIVRHFKKLYDMGKITRAYYISGGYIGLMDALLSGSKEHLLVSYIEQAKQIYAMNRFNRLLFIDEFIKSKQSLDQLLQAMYIFSRVAIYQSVTKNNFTSVQRWIRIQRQLLEFENVLPKNPQAKLALSSLMVNL